MAYRLGRNVGYQQQQYRRGYNIPISLVFRSTDLLRNQSTSSVFVTFGNRRSSSFNEVVPTGSRKSRLLTPNLDKRLQAHHVKCKHHRCTRVAYFSTIPEEALDAAESDSSTEPAAGGTDSSTLTSDLDSQSDPVIDIDIESSPSPPPPPPTSSSSSSQNTFEDLPNLHPVTKEAIRSMNIVTMTEIQAKTWEAAITGKDVLGRSRTGSGKTLAFLVPALERILRSHTQTDKNKIKMLIISPTRELAHQIYSTTLLLTNKFGKNNNTQPIHCQVMYGGTPKIQDIQKMQKNIPTIVTSTPGRLLDHLKTTTIHGNTSFVQYIKDIDVLVLDEMDLLLDMGFRDDVQNILSFLSNSSSNSSPSTNNKQRQTLLFSATLPHGVKDVIRRYIRRDHVVVDCIQDSDPSSHTVSTVEQSHVILPPDKIVAGTVQTILQLMKSNMQHKIIVFFPTTSQVTYYSAVFNSGLGRRVIEIHSGISQGARTNRSDNFRHSKTASVLFTSDVSARGVDYPNVTHVLQVGAASNRETYIHRLGRTGRAGKSGQGIILLLPDEVDFIRRDLHDINIPMNSMLQNLLKMEVDGSDLENHMSRIHDLTNKSPDMKKAASDVYRNLFGYYAQRFKAMNVRNFEEALVGLVNGFAKQAGLNEMPLLSSKIVAQYRLSQHPALNVQRQWDTGSRNFDVGRGNRFGGGGRGRGGGDGDGFGGFRGRGNGGGRSGNYFGNFGQTRNERPSGSMSVSSSPLPSSKDWHGYV